MAAGQATSNVDLKPLVEQLLAASTRQSVELAELRGEIATLSRNVVQPLKGIRRELELRVDRELEAQVFTARDFVKWFVACEKDGTFRLFLEIDDGSVDENRYEEERWELGLPFWLSFGDVGVVNRLRRSGNDLAHRVPQDFPSATAEFQKACESPGYFGRLEADERAVLQKIARHLSIKGSRRELRKPQWS